MKTRLFVVSALVLLLLVAGQSFAQEQYIPTGVSPTINVAQMGMGGMTTMISTNARTVFNNPGLLNRQKFALEITPAALGIGSDATNILKFVNDNMDVFTGMDSIAASAMDPADPNHEENAATLNQFYKDSEEFDNKWIGVNASPYIGLAFKGFGFGVYGNVVTDLKLDNGVFVPALGARGYIDAVFGAGMGRTMEIGGRDWELGAAVRVVNRRYVSPIRVNASDVANMGDMASTVMDELNEDVTGFGIDVGMIRTMQWKDNDIDVGVAIQDLVGVMDGYLAPNVKMGAMYHMPFAGNALLNRWDVGIEYTDFFNRAGKSYFTHINMGTELSVLAGFVKLRGGFHQGYPTFGGGLSLLFLKLDYAYFTKELGTAPGMNAYGLHMVQMSLGW